MTCSICRSTKVSRLGEYAHCKACGYWSSDLPVDVQDTSQPDEAYELVSYDHTRRANYTSILEMLERRHPRGSRMLELGCADGLFLQMAAERNGYTAIGVEPNEKMAAGNRYAQDIRAGFFPGVLAGDTDKFNIIALNCVFEHLPDVDAMIEHFKRYLAPGGSVMINVPVASGFMFKVARALYTVRVRYPFDRIWQKNFVSPHLHYFASGNLSSLFARHGLERVDECGLALFSLGGIYARLSLDPNIRFAQRISALGFMYAYYPVSRLVPDARAFVFASQR